MLQDLNLVSDRPEGLSREEIRAALEKAFEGRRPRRVLVLPPDFTRFHSNAGFISETLWHMLKARGAEVDFMPALGTHVPVTESQWKAMFGEIPFSRMLVHDWRGGVEKIGEIPADVVSEITDGLWKTPLAVELNRKLLDGTYDLMVSVGQVVPHEVIGMANHAKNLFVGVGGSQMINCSHMIGAVCGMEKAMGRDHAPVRRLFDWAMERFVYGKIPVLFALTVTTAPGGKIRQHGLFVGEGRECLTAAVALAQEKNVDFVDKPFRKCVVYLDPSEFTSTWVGNKAIYRTRMAMADGGELVVLAPGVERFGEDPAQQTLIRKYGYKGRLHTLEVFEKPESADLRENMGVAAHLIHGSSDGRFSVTYAVKKIAKSEIEAVGFRAADYDETAAKYDPAKLVPGVNVIDGEEIFYIPNPALGLWIDRSRLAD
ncbi:MAG: DUF2088 domain-containing protein [Kiritimatiellae bacterium]|nr:DUF2088 domain-containing protein [Kiritimatiellia bacterium]